MRPIRALVLAAAIASGLAACSGSAPTHYYSLVAMAGSPAAAPSGAHTLAVVPVKIPEYLNRLEIVTRDSQNGLVLASLDQWGEPLDYGLTRVVSTDLAILLKNQPVAVTTLSPSLATYALWLQVRRFEVDAGGNCILEATWVLSKGDPDQPLSRGEAAITEPAGQSGYPAAVGAMNRAADELSRRIAQNVQPHLR
jgi:uncharacterized protein